MELTVATATFRAKSAGRGESLVRAIESVAALGFPHEHIVVDGGSSDGSTALVEGRPAVKLVSEPDRGIYDALNKALAAARGEWFYVLGDDDEIIDGGVLARALAFGERTGADMVASPVVTDAGWTIGARPRNVLTGMAYPHQGLLVRTRRLRELGGFDLRYRIAGDYDSCLKLHLGGAKCRVFPEVYTRFSVGGLSRDLAAADAETVAALADRLALTSGEAEFVRRRRVLPLRRSLPLLVHRNRVIRRAAVHQLAKLLFGWIRR